VEICGESGGEKRINGIGRLERGRGGGGRSRDVAAVVLAALVRLHVRLRA
jgi:hypothetical protein